MITAHMQKGQQHICSIDSCILAVLGEGMDPARKTIALWLERQMRRLRWTPQRWAVEAGTSATNITRALKPDEKPLMTFKTQEMLARAAGVPSALDYLLGGVETKPAAGLPSAETLQFLLPELLQASADVRLPESRVRPTASALSLCLQLLAENPAIHANPDAIKAVVHAVTAQLPEPTLEA